jgi:glycosyltransferase involved in cell wall biosynthesis
MDYFNQSNFIEEAVDSVLNQTYQDFEIIIGNDSSSDIDLFESIIKKDKRISYFCLKDVGGTSTRTSCIHKAKGDYILPLDPDDTIEKTFLEKTYKKLCDNNSYAFCYTDSIFYSKEKMYRHFQPEYNFAKLLDGNYICYCSLIKKDAWEKVGGYNLKNFNYFEDYELWIRLGKFGFYGIHIPEPLFFYRISENSMSSRTEDFGKIYKSFLIKWYPELFNLQIQEAANEILKDIPNNFMGFKPTQQREFWESYKNKEQNKC